MPLGSYSNSKSKRGEFKVQVRFHIDEADDRALSRACHALGITKSEAFRQAVKQWLEECVGEAR